MDAGIDVETPAGRTTTGRHGWPGRLRPADGSFHFHREADTFQTAYKLSGGTFRVQPIQVVSAALMVLRAVANHRPGDLHNPMGHSNGGLFETALVRDAM